MSSAEVDALWTISKLQELSGDDPDGLKSRLAIIRISEPIFSEAGFKAENAESTPSKRGSDASALDNPTPASLETDLAHYKASIPALRLGQHILTDEIGTIFKATLFLRRASHQGEIPQGDCR